MDFVFDVLLPTFFLRLIWKKLNQLTIYTETGQNPDSPQKNLKMKSTFFLWKKIQFIHVFGCFLSYYNIVVVSIFFVKINIWGSDKKQEVVTQVYFVWVFPISLWRNSYVNKQKLSQVYLVWALLPKRIKLSPKTTVNHTCLIYDAATYTAVKLQSIWFHSCIFHTFDGRVVEKELQRST